jgi:DNA-binding MarR family transcriptional regulator
MNRSRSKSDLPRIVCACTNLKMTARAVGRAWDEALAPSGINATQYAILVNVGRHESISQARLADHLGLERTTLYRAVELMERKRWLKTRPLGEGVTRMVELAPAGQERLAVARPLWERAQSGFVRAFGQKRWEETLAVLDEIRALVGQ